MRPRHRPPARRALLAGLIALLGALLAAPAEGPADALPTFEDPLVVYDGRPEDGSFERVQVGLYPEDSPGVAVVFTVLLRDPPPGDADVVVAWSAAGESWETLTLTRVASSIWVGELADVPLGRARMGVRLEEGDRVQEHFGTTASPIAVDVGFAPPPEPAPAPVPPPPPPDEVDDDGYVTVYTERASGAVTDLRVSVDPEGPPRRVRVEVGVDGDRLRAAPERVLLDINAQASSWNAVPLRWEPDTGRWARTVRIPEYGPAYLAVRVEDADGNMVFGLGNRGSSARRVDLHPATERRDIPETSYRRPKILHEQVTDSGTIAFVEVAGFLDDPDGLGVRFRVQLRERPPGGARVRVAFNGASAPWVTVRLEQVDDLTYAGFLAPVHGGPALFAVEVTDPGWEFLDQLGSRASPLRVLVDLAEQAEQPFRDPEP